MLEFKSYLDLLKTYFRRDTDSDRKIIDYAFENIDAFNSFATDYMEMIKNNKRDVLFNNNIGPSDNISIEIKEVFTKHKIFLDEISKNPDVVLKVIIFLLPITQVINSYNDDKYKFISESNARDIFDCVFRSDTSIVKYNEIIAISVFGFPKPADNASTKDKLDRSRELYTKLKDDYMPEMNCVCNIIGFNFSKYLNVLSSSCGLKLVETMEKPNTDNIKLLKDISLDKYNMNKCKIKDDSSGLSKNMLILIIVGGVVGFIFIVFILYFLLKDGK